MLAELTHLGGQAFNAVTSGGNPVNSMITAGYTPGMEGANDANL
jgi:hypothetical protein